MKYLHNHDTLFDDFSSLLLAGKLILNEGGHLPFLVFRRLVFSLNHPVWAGQGDQFHYMNEDLNNPISNKRNQYLLDFIRETQLAYNNSSKTFVNSMGQEASEIDYVLHNLKEGEYSKKTVLQNLPENTSSLR
jgi:hypothetical protein